MPIYFYFLCFQFISSLGRGWLLLIKLESASPRAKIGWNWPSGSGEEDENVKSVQTDGWTDGQTDRRQTTFDQKSSLVLSAQVSLIYFLVKFDIVQENNSFKRLSLFNLCLPIFKLDSKIMYNVILPCCICTLNFPLKLSRYF